MMAVAEFEIRRVAIVDDNLNDAEVMGELVRDAGFEPIVLEPPFGEISDLLRAVQQQADAVVCDHRLRGLAGFWGAQGVAALIEQRIPALLVTQYIDHDADDTIRRWRQHVPILLSRDDADPDRIKEGLGSCIREIQGEYPPGRRPWRALIQIERVTNYSDQSVVEARIPPWNSQEIVRFPLALVPPDLRDKVIADAFLFAMVNIGAEKSEDLYFYDFEAAPDPATEESLG
jgi:CheY-like chemotaxis protein